MAINSFSRMLSCDQKSILEEAANEIAEERGIRPEHKIHWSVFYEVFNPARNSERESLEKIMTRSLNSSNKENTLGPQESGIRIFKEEAQFLPTGEYLVALKWGEYKREKRD